MPELKPKIKDFSIMIVLTIAAGSTLLSITAAASGVALFQTDSLRRRDALQVLRITVGATALTGAVAAAARLHDVLLW